MKRFVALALFISILSVGCNNHSTKFTSDESAGMGKGIWYKRYTGTIAGQQVVVNLYSEPEITEDEGISATGGNYYYKNKSQIINLSISAGVNDTILVTEYVSTERDAEDGTPAKAPGSWKLNISGKTATGQWFSGDGQKTYNINLTEDYTGAFAFDITKYSDSLLYDGKYIKGKHAGTSALIPLLKNAGKEEEAFFTNTLLKKLGGDTVGVTTMQGFVEKDSKQYLQRYQKIMGEEDVDTSAASIGEMNNWQNTIAMIPLYNDRHMLEIEMNDYDYSGGAHGNYFSSFVCMDMEKHKVWELGDVMNVDTAKLCSLLEQEVRNQFRMKQGDTLSKRLPVDAVPVAHNFYISDMGITFVYNPYVIAPFADGQVCVFLSYDKLKDMLTDRFKKRMGL